MTSGYRDFVAGTASGIAGILVGQPIDTLKVRLQAAPEKYKSSLASMSHIVRNEGVSVLRITLHSLISYFGEMATDSASIVFCTVEGKHVSVSRRELQ